MAALFVSATNVEEGIYLFFILLGMGQLLFSKQFKKVPFFPLFFLLSGLGRWMIQVLKFLLHENEGLSVYPQHT